MSIHSKCLLQTLIGRAGQTRKSPFLKRGKGAKCSKTSCQSSLTTGWAFPARVSFGTAHRQRASSQPH